VIPSEAATIASWRTIKDAEQDFLVRYPDFARPHTPLRGEDMRELAADVDRLRARIRELEQSA
jgi:hypothetical protein